MATAEPKPERCHKCWARPCECTSRGDAKPKAEPKAETPEAKPESKPKKAK